MNIRYTPVACLFTALVILAIWLPEVVHYYVSSPSITPDIIKKSREHPSSSLMKELAGLSLGSRHSLSDPELIHAADDIKKGSLRLSGSTSVRISIPYDPRDLDEILPTAQLQFASLVAPDILLDAYAVSGNDEYFKLAQEMIHSWAKYEKGKWLPKGFLWNDHAIAARVSVLSKFWGVYRARADFDPLVAEAVLEFVSRSGEMLSKESHFTFATNHGVMQNVALLHIASAFPVLPGSTRFRQIALDRLSDQMAFYIDNQGVVLEHSAGYQSHGMLLIGMILRYLTLNAIDPPPSWVAKYEKSKAFMAMIRRPDGTLPIFGDTNGGRNADLLVTTIDNQGKASPLYPMKEWRPSASQALYPVAGYSIWWDSLNSSPNTIPVSQTVMAWSNFAGHGHKTADEMSLILWADEQTWLTNTGYWPYVMRGREKAESWDGSNAPHLVGEPENSDRRTEMRAYAVQNRLAVNHLQREGPDGYTVNRQVIHWGPDLWIIIDNALDQSVRETTTTWTFSPDLKLSDSPRPGQYRLSRADASSCMSTFFAGSKGTQINTYTGSNEPFAGWVVVGSRPTAASSVRVQQPSTESWALTVLSLEQHCKERFVGQPNLDDWKGADRWTVSLPLKEGNIEVQRVGASVSITNESLRVNSVQLTSPSLSNVSTERKAIDDTFHLAAKKYKKHKDLSSYRLTVTYLLLATLFIQEVFFFLYARIIRTYQVALRMISIAGWIVGGGWICLVYFKT